MNKEIKKLQAEKAKIEKSMASSLLSDDNKKMLQVGIDKIEAKIKAIEDMDSEGDKGASAPKEKKTPAPRVKKATVVSFKGKDYEQDSAELCEALIVNFNERRALAKKTKKKTKPVMESVTDKVASVVTTAIKKSLDNNKDKFDKNPEIFIKKFEKLESDAKVFMTSLKDTLGEDYDAEEITSTVKEIEALIDKLRSKKK